MPEGAIWQPLLRNICAILYSGEWTCSCSQQACHTAEDGELCQAAEWACCCTFSIPAG